MAAILSFKCTEGAGVGDYSLGGGREKPNRPRPLSGFDTHAGWQPVTQSPRSRRSWRKNRGQWAVYQKAYKQMSIIFNGATRLDPSNNKFLDPLFSGFWIRRTFKQFKVPPRDTPNSLFTEYYEKRQLRRLSRMYYEKYHSIAKRKQRRSRKWPSPFMKILKTTFRSLALLKIKTA